MQMGALLRTVHARGASKHQHSRSAFLAVGVLLLLGSGVALFGGRGSSAVNGLQHRKLQGEESSGFWHRSCTPPKLNTTAPALGEQCTTVEDVCFDQGMVVLYGKEYLPANNPSLVKPFPNFTVHDVLHNWVGMANVTGNENVSSLYFPNVTFRMHSRAEPTMDMEDPVFNACRVPLIIWQNFPFNYFETVVHAVSRVHMLEADGSMPNTVDLVIATPGGQRLKPYHTQLLEPFTTHPVRSFADFSSRQRAQRLSSGTSASAATGEPGRCFKKAMLCKWKRAEYWDAWHAMQWVENYHRSALTNFAEKTKWANTRFAQADTMRVVFDGRLGPVRNILNAKELVEACNSEKKWHIDRESRFRKVKCSFVHFNDELRHNAEAVRSAHVMVGVHGGLATALLMRHGSALLELLPYNFTECCAPHDHYYPQLLRWNREAVHYWSISIEDPSAWKPGEFEVKRQARGVDPNPFDMRDRHVYVRWDALKDVLERIASVGLDSKRYSEVKEAKEHLLAMTDDDIMTLKEYKVKEDAGVYVRT